MVERLPEVAGWTPVAIVNRIPTIPNINLSNRRKFRSGKIGWALLWLIGVPVPLLVIFYLLRGCS